MWCFLSTFTSEITNRNCRVTFLLIPPPPKVSRIILMAPYYMTILSNIYIEQGPTGPFYRFHEAFSKSYIASNHLNCKKPFSKSNMGLLTIQM